MRGGSAQEAGEEEAGGFGWVEMEMAGPERRAASVFHAMRFARIWMKEPTAPRARTRMMNHAAGVAK